jgi:ADP-ribose pyrophosphatase YjhB (NUDIX family)
MNEKEILKIIKRFDEKLPKFPDGRINYSNSDAAPVITVFVKYDDKILLMKRSDKVSTYRGKWNPVAGYLDESKPIREKVLEEMREEIGVKENSIESIRIGKSYELTDTEINKTWITFPVLVELKNKPDIKLDWEHTEYRWIKPEELKNFDTIPKLVKSWENVSYE